MRLDISDDSIFVLYLYRLLPRYQFWYVQSIDCRTLCIPLSTLGVVYDGVLADVFNDQLIIASYSRRANFFGLFFFFFFFFFFFKKIHIYLFVPPSLFQPASFFPFFQASARMHLDGSIPELKSMLVFREAAILFLRTWDMMRFYPFPRHTGPGTLTRLPVAFHVAAGNP